MVSTRWRVNTSDPDSPWCEIVQRTVVPRANLASVAAYNLRVKAGLSAGSNPPLTTSGRTAGAEPRFVRSFPEIAANYTRTSRDRKRPKPSYAILNHPTCNSFPVSYITMTRSLTSRIDLL